MSAVMKTCGMIMIICATTGYGMMMSRDLRKRLSELREVKKIVFLLCGEISYSHTPLFEAAGVIADRCEKPFDEILKKLESEGKSLNGISASELWKNVWQDEYRRLSLSQHEKERIIMLGESLGLPDVSSQEHALREFAGELEGFIEDLERTVPVKTRLYGSLGVMCGIFISIILV